MPRAMLDGLDLFWRTRFLSETGDMPRERYELILPYIRAWAKGRRAAMGLPSTGASSRSSAFARPAPR